MLANQKENKALGSKSLRGFGAERIIVNLLKANFSNTALLKLNSEEKFVLSEKRGVRGMKTWREAHSLGKVIS
jgi:hypothetical protein